MFEQKTNESAAFRDVFEKLHRAMSSAVIGRDEEIRALLAAFFAGGHVLIESEPGLGKTLLAKAFSKASGLASSRIQFTPDLMPADITGTNIFVQDADGRRRFEFREGPVFTQVLLADEITRATPKTQSALLEAMQERRVTAAGETRKLADPFFVVATQPPEGSHGTYPLPEAQVDRFLVKLTLEYPGDETLREIGRRSAKSESDIAAVSNAEELRKMQRLVREVKLTPGAANAAAKAILATHPDTPEHADLSPKYVRFGASPRGAQALILTGKVNALLDGRTELRSSDITSFIVPCLRHRIILNFEAGIENIRSESIIKSASGVSL